MASNGRGSLRPHHGSKTPPFVLIGLLVVIVILGFNYWNASSKSSLLSKEILLLNEQMRSVSLKQSSVDKRNEELVAQVVERERENTLCKTTIADKDGLAAQLTTSIKQLESQKNEEANTCRSNLDQERLNHEASAARLQKQHDNQLADTRREVEDEAHNNCVKDMRAKKKEILQIIAEKYGKPGILHLQQAGIDVSVIDINSIPELPSSPTVIQSLQYALAAGRPDLQDMHAPVAGDSQPAVQQQPHLEGNSLNPPNQLPNAGLTFGNRGDTIQGQLTETGDALQRQQYPVAGNSQGQLTTAAGDSQGQLNSTVGGSQGQLNSTVGGSQDQLNSTVGGSQDQLNSTVGGSQDQLNSTVGGGQLYLTVGGSQGQLKQNFSDTQDPSKQTVWDSLDQREQNISDTHDQSKQTVGDSLDQLKQTFNDTHDLSKQTVGDSPDQLKQNISDTPDQLEQTVRDSQGQFKQIVGGLQTTVGYSQGYLTTAVADSQGQLKPVDANLQGQSNPNFDDFQGQISPTSSNSQVQFNPPGSNSQGQFNPPGSNVQGQFNPPGSSNSQGQFNPAGSNMPGNLNPVGYEAQGRFNPAVGDATQVPGDKGQGQIAGLPAGETGQGSNAGDSFQVQPPQMAGQQGMSSQGQHEQEANQLNENKFDGGKLEGNEDQHLAAAAGIVEANEHMIPAGNVEISDKDEEDDEYVEEANPVNIAQDTVQRKDEALRFEQHKDTMEQVLDEQDGIDRMNQGMVNADRHLNKEAELPETPQKQDGRLDFLDDNTEEELSLHPEDKLAEGELPDTPQKQDLLLKSKVSDGDYADDDQYANEDKVADDDYADDDQYANEDEYEDDDDYEDEDELLDEEADDGPKMQREYNNGEGDYEEEEADDAGPLDNDAGLNGEYYDAEEEGK